MKRLIGIILLFVSFFTMTSCGDSQSVQSPDRQNEPESTHFEAEPDGENGTIQSRNHEEESEEEENQEMKMKVQVGDSTFTAILENNAAVDALVEMMEEEPVVIQMSDYAGFEKVGPLGESLPANNSQTTTEAGDIVLYQGNQIVIFYGSNSWSYTRLGRIEDLTGWKEALGSGDVTVTFSLED